MYKPGKINPYYLNAYLYLQPYYTTTKSYVKIQPLQGVLPCKQMQEVWVDYSIAESDLGESTKAEGVTFSYYVSTLGRAEMGDGAWQWWWNSEPHNLRERTSFPFPSSVVLFWSTGLGNIKKPASYLGEMKMGDCSYLDDFIPEILSPSLGDRKGENPCTWTKECGQQGWQ